MKPRYWWSWAFKCWLLDTSSLHPSEWAQWPPVLFSVPAYFRGEAGRFVDCAP